MSEIRHEDDHIETSQRYAWLDTLLSVVLMIVLVAFALCVGYMALEAVL